MTDEERQRQMDFIVNTLAHITASQEQAAIERKATEAERKATELERKADAVRIGRLEDSMVTLARVNETLTQLAQKYGERLDEHDAQITDVKQAIVILTKLLNEGRNGKA